MDLQIVDIRMLVLLGQYRRTSATQFAARDGVLRPRQSEPPDRFQKPGRRACDDLTRVHAASAARGWFDAPDALDCTGSLQMNRITLLYRFVSSPLPERV